MPRPTEIRTRYCLVSEVLVSTGQTLLSAPPSILPRPQTVRARPRQAPPPLAQLAEAAVDMVQAWYMDESTADPRMPHRAHPDRPVGLEQLRTLGVLYWKVRVRAGAPRPCTCGEGRGAPRMLGTALPRSLLTTGFWACFLRGARPRSQLAFANATTPPASHVVASRVTQFQHERAADIVGRWWP